MGIKGLARFIIDNAGDFLLPEVLDCGVLVLDGYNVLHDLYYTSAAETAYGGDYDVFADAVEQFCKKLRDNGIKPYFVFDGSSDLLDAKFGTRKERAKERIKLAGMSRHGKKEKILPGLAFNVSTIEHSCVVGSRLSVLVHFIDIKIMFISNSSKL